MYLPHLAQGPALTRQQVVGVFGADLIVATVVRHRSARIQQHALAFKANTKASRDPASLAHAMQGSTPFSKCEPRRIRVVKLAPKFLSPRG